MWVKPRISQYKTKLINLGLLTLLWSTALSFTPPSHSGPVWISVCSHFDLFSTKTLLNDVKHCNGSVFHSSLQRNSLMFWGKMAHLSSKFVQVMSAVIHVRLLDQPIHFILRCRHFNNQLKSMQINAVRCFQTQNMTIWFNLGSFYWGNKVDSCLVGYSSELATTALHILYMIYTDIFKPFTVFFIIRHICLIYNTVWDGNCSIMFQCWRCTVVFYQLCLWGRFHLKPSVPMTFTAHILVIKAMRIRQSENFS